MTDSSMGVLNLIINGLPSILTQRFMNGLSKYLRFKPYYKWITFNTDVSRELREVFKDEVLNLIINGLPSILYGGFIMKKILNLVLNLIINGLPSIPLPKG